MKTISRNLVTVGALIGLATVAQAETLYYYGNASNWLGANVWRTTDSSGGPQATWNSATPDNAIFSVSGTVALPSAAVTAGSITVNDGVTTTVRANDTNSQLNFNSLGYGGSGTMNFVFFNNSGSAARGLTLNSSNDFTVRGTFTTGGAGTVTSAAFTKSGNGAMTLSSTGNTAVASVTVASGSLLVTGSWTSATGYSVQAEGILGGGLAADVSAPANTRVSSITLQGGATVGGILSPGNVEGDMVTLRSTGGLTWNGTTDGPFAQMRFTLDTVSDMSDGLVLAGDFLRGSGSNFVFDFGNGGLLGQTYTLISGFTGTNFDASDFSYVNLGGGLSGTFALQANTLTFTTIPEPATGVLVIGGLLAAALFRRLRRR